MIPEPLPHPVTPPGDRYSSCIAVAAIFAGHEQMLELRTQPVWPLTLNTEKTANGVDQNSKPRLRAEFAVAIQTRRRRHGRATS